ncbi:hypothetical protein PVAG01_07654 [Phlyctema vagabunda]|uniref:Rhodopsin domain-containing protein n=1 Tax=Phlyctema vagabunda TaxID=108571 RepID=A0ABR4PD12_9HELO
MGVRLFMRNFRGQKFSVSDYLTVGAIIFLIARVCTIHFVLVYGTNNIKASLRTIQFAVSDIQERQIGSKLALVTRFCYNNYIWLQKSVVMLLVQRVLDGPCWPETTIRIYWILLAVTFTVVQIMTFVECRPFHLYWQVVPDPGICTRARVQVIVLGTLNIFTDILLILLPMPRLLKLRLSSVTRLRIIGLFSLGIFVVIVTLIRLPLNLKNSNSQVSRTILASAEILAAAGVANIPTLYALRRRSSHEIHDGSDRSQHVHFENILCDSLNDFVLSPTDIHVSAIGRLKS